MKRVRTAALLLLLLSLTGCFRQSIRALDQEGLELTDRGGEHESHTSFGFLYGLIPGKTKVDCPNGIARVDTGFPWYGIFAIYVTAGLVVPLKATYICNASPESEVGPAAEPNYGW